MTAGEMHTCALLADTTVECWGDNTFNQLGDGTTDSTPTPQPVPGLTAVTALAAGQDHTCALMQDGTVQCWGKNVNGQLGNGGFTNAPSPAAISGLTGVSAISASGRSTCALLTSGAVTCWGHDTPMVSFLGDSATPIAVPSVSGAVSISVGPDHSCAVLDTGAVTCWGENSFGQIWAGMAGSFGGPSAPPGLSGITAVTAGNEHTCVVLDTGAVSCWGSYAQPSGEAGEGGTMAASSTPVTMTGVSSAVGIVSPDNSPGSCALLNNGDVMCWGDDYYGVFGDGNADHLVTAPTLEPNLAGLTSISLSWTHGCAVTADGRLECWGWPAGLGQTSPEGVMTPAQIQTSSLEAAGTPCRPAAGPCDVAEVCDGVSPDCPQDQLVTAGQQCGSSTGECDLSATCTGASADCPANALVAAGTACGATPADLCQTQGTCTGASGICPGPTTLPANQCVSIPSSSNPNTSVDLLGGDSVPGGISITFGGPFSTDAGTVEIKVVAGSGGSAPPDGYKIVSDPMYWEIEATPGYQSPRVCIGVSPSWGNVCAMSLDHDAGSGYQNVTTVRCDSTGHLCCPTTPCPVQGYPCPTGVPPETICGTTTSFSPFTIVEPIGPPPDTTPPVWSNVPGTVVAYATSKSGAKVTYTTPTATDAVDGNRAVTCTPASGSTFPINKTTVTCTATDKHGNTATTTFTVWVQYQTPTDGSFFLLPLLANGKALFPIGPLPLPVVFHLTGTSAGITNLTATFSATKISSSVVSGTTTIAGTAGTTASTGTTFNYVPLLKVYDFLWKVSNQTQGTYQINVSLGDGVPHQLNVSLKALK
ncbi:MAG TPA: HYR domain-containing protein [Polyangia bacterium]|nr:HYR domain-containing protein [Polyangia bacterium]